ncbi:SIP domain-containing protein [Rhodococcus hoagii]|nr:SIP domain-containing protein [Prescottella equi]
MELFRATVVDATALTPGMIRIVFGGLNGFTSTGVGDEYLRLHFPVPATGEFVLPEIDPNATNGRGWIYPEGKEPSPCQPYTVRRFDGGRGEMTIDFVVHEGGVASDWAQSAQPGDVLYLGASRGLYEPPAHTEWQIFVTDATGLPALGRLVENLPAHVRATAIVEVADPSHEQRIESAADVEFVWLHGTGNGIAASALPEAIRRLSIPEGTGYIWVAGESTMLRDIRKYLRHDLGIAADAYKVIGYWTYKAEEWRARYDALDETVKARLDAVWDDTDRDEEDIRDEVDRTLENAGL